MSAQSDSDRRDTANVLLAENVELRKRTCLCAFRGKGYGPIFESVENVQRERDRLRAANEALRAILLAFCSSVDEVGRSCGECMGCKLVAAAKRSAASDEIGETT